MSIGDGSGVNDDPLAGGLPLDHTGKNILLRIFPENSLVAPVKHQPAHNTAPIHCLQGRCNTIRIQGLGLFKGFGHNIDRFVGRGRSVARLNREPVSAPIGLKKNFGRRILG